MFNIEIGKEYAIEKSNGGITALKVTGFDGKIIEGIAIGAPDQGITSVNTSYVVQTDPLATYNSLFTWSKHRFGEKKSEQ